MTVCERRPDLTGPGTRVGSGEVASQSPTQRESSERILGSYHPCDLHYSQCPSLQPECHSSSRIPDRFVSVAHPDPIGNGSVGASLIGYRKGEGGSTTVMVLIHGNSDLVERR